MELWPLPCRFRDDSRLYDFKAVLPLVDIEWECRYRAGSEKADLVIFDGECESIVIEAKWWMSNQAKALSALSDDIDKMLAWPGLEGRYLLTFWHSPNSQEMWEKDLGDVHLFCKQFNRARVRPVYAAAFPTDVLTTRLEGGSVFAICALSIDNL